MRCVVTLVCLFAASCTGSEAGQPPARYRAQVRWTSYGVPHFLAEDLPSAAYAHGYVASKDVVCILADQFVRLRSERSKYFGPGEMDANLTSDFGILAAGVRATALATFPKLDPESRDLIVAYAAGYDRYLAETPRDALPEPCRGAEWVQPISPEDLWTYYYYLSLGPGIDAIFARMAKGAPDQLPGDPPVQHFEGASSNGWAIGKDRSQNARGMLLANPHLPWQGPRRLYEQQITVPGVLNVYGAGWTGVPLIAVGFNEDVAWTHTTTTANHTTLYKLTLVPGKPTHYILDGQEREMSAHDFQIEVKQPDGSLRLEQRTLYRSHYGAMLGDFGTPWSDTDAYTYRDAGEGNVDWLRAYLGMNRARSLEALEGAQAEAQGLSWLNIIAVSNSGTALYFDASRTPLLSEAAEQAFRAAIVTDYDTGLSRNGRQALLPGNSSLFDWQGIFPQAASPRLLRTDFVANSNDSHWLINPAAPLRGFSALFGDDPSEQRSLPWTLLSARSRMSLKLLTESGATSAAGADNKFSLDELAAVPFNDRALLGELLRDDVVERCTAQPSVELGDELVDLREACAVLASWDLRVAADSRGAPLWRGFLADFYNIFLGAVGLFADTLDPNDPIATPRTLTPATPESDPVLQALAGAVQRLQSVGSDASATLGSLQFTQRGAQRVPIQGGLECEGAFNIVDYQARDGTLLPGQARGVVLDALGLTAEGYPVNSGSSFMLVMSFTDAGPVARVLLSYSQSADPGSPHYADQTRLFAAKTWRDVRFREAEIRADAELHEDMVVSP